MDLIRQFPAEVLTEALQDWLWLRDLAELAPLAVSPFGDVILYAPDGVWFLDTIEGTVTREWDHPAALQDALNTLEGQDRYLLLGLLQQATDAGLEPDDSQVLSFKVPPMLGGAFEVDNIEVADLSVTLSIGGQVHRQIKDLPPGTKISGFTVEGDDSPPAEPNS